MGDVTESTRSARFIGRLDELGALTRALDDAADGRPHVAIVTGGAALGKSRLVAEFLILAKAAGARTFVGACHEDISIPYLPIATALRPLTDLAGRWPDAVHTDEWDSAAAERTRLQLFLDVTAALMDASWQPLVLVIEDVHWADAATSELLTHLCRTVLYEGRSNPLRVLIVLTTRPAVEKQLPFFLERLTRDPDAITIPVAPFTQEETHAYLASAFGAHPPSELLIDVHEATRGHPLLLRSTVARLVAHGAEPDAGDRAALRAPDLRLAKAADVDRELALLLAELDDDTREFLTIAACIGDGRTLSRLDDVHDGDTDRALTVAVDAGLVDVTDDGRFRFVHPELRHALLGALDPRQRERLHRRIADALEKRASEDDAYEIATHLAQAGDVSPHHLLHWAVLAGDRAAAAGAWAQSMKAYEIAIARGDVLGEPALGSLLVKAGTASWMSYDPSGCEHLRRAVDMAHARGDAVGRAEALLGLIRFHVSRSAVRESIFPDDAECDEALDALGEHHAALRAALLANMADMASTAMDLARCRELAVRAEAAMEGTDDDGALVRVHLALGLMALGEMDVGVAHAHYAKAEAVAERAGNVLHRDVARTRLGMIHLIRGELDRARELLERTRRENAHHGFWGEHMIASGTLAGVSLAQGRFHEVEQLVADALSLYRIDEYTAIPGMTYPTLAVERSIRGDVDGAKRALTAWASTGVRGTWRYEAVVQVLSGDEGTVRAQLAARMWPAPPAGNIFTVDLAAAQIEVAAAIGSRELAGPARDVLEHARERGIAFTPSAGWCVPRLLAECALLFGNADLAERLFGEADRLASSSGARLEHGRAQLGLARTRLLRGDRPGARNDADEAARTFDAIGALVEAHRARSVSGTYDVERSGTPTFRVLLVTDLQDSTGLNVSVGDERYLRLLNEHDGIIRKRLREFDGVEFQHRGDGIAAWFTSASDAVTCALAIREDMASATGEHPELPLVVRLGIAAGEPIGVGAELFGLAVVVACRICDIAQAGQILVAEEVAGLARGKNFTFANKGEFALKGLPAPTTLYEAAAG